MKANRILPDLQCSLMCEDVRQESSGNLILIGVLGLIRLPQIPVWAPKLCVVNRWVAGIGQFTEEVRLVAPDGTTVVRKNQAKFALPDAVQSMTLVSLFQNVEFNVAGIYTLEVLVDDVMKIRVPIPVTVVTPPAGQASQFQPPAAPPT